MQPSPCSTPPPATYRRHHHIRPIQFHRHGHPPFWPSQAVCQLRPPIPFHISHMHSFEYLALVGSFVLVGLEAIVRVLTLALRMCFQRQSVSHSVNNKRYLHSRDPLQPRPFCHSFTSHRAASSTGSPRRLTGEPALARNVLFHPLSALDQRPPTDWLTPKPR